MKLKLNTELFSSLLAKLELTAVGTLLSAYFGQLILPLILLFMLMAADYISGIIKAWIKAEISSAKGYKGIVKKLSYVFLLGTSMAADYLISLGLNPVRIDGFNGIGIGLITTVWLSLNEMLSILENLSAIGVPVPSFLEKIVKKLKISTEGNKTE